MEQTLEQTLEQFTAEVAEKAKEFLRTEEGYIPIEIVHNMREGNSMKTAYYIELSPAERYVVLLKTDNLEEVHNETAECFKLKGEPEVDKWENPAGFRFNYTKKAEVNDKLTTFIYLIPTDELDLYNDYVTDLTVDFLRDLFKDVPEVKGEMSLPYFLGDN